jgi:nucleotide-binding universal stress UspA family protein
MVERGPPGRVLTVIASDPGDLLVVGTGRRGTLTRVFPGRVSRYCLAHARCPVLAVPPATVSRTPATAAVGGCSGTAH